jgi:hypothetical protein
MNQPTLPNLLKQAKNFTIAYSRWVAAGKPLREPKQVEELFKICEGCPSKQFIRVDADSGRCAECGCWVRRSMDRKNKLKWPTERCPFGHFNNEVQQDFLSYPPPKVEDDPEIII